MKYHNIYFLMLSKFGIGDIFSMSMTGQPDEIFFFYVKARDIYYDSCTFRLEIQYSSYNYYHDYEVSDNYEWYPSSTVRLSDTSAQSFTFKGWILNSGYKVIVDKILMICVRDADGYGCSLRKPNISDPYIVDSDWDGLLDGEEIKGYETTDNNIYDSDPLDIDTDNDKLRDGVEVGLSSSYNSRNINTGGKITDPSNIDTDLDHLPDGWVDGWGYDTINEDWGIFNQNGIMDMDYENSNIIYYEFEDKNLDGDCNDDITGSFFLSGGGGSSRGESDSTRADTDEDGIADWFEIFIWKTQVKDKDSDDDGIIDGDEVYTYYTDPILWDNDGDSLNDGVEVGLYYLWDDQSSDTITSDNEAKWELIDEFEDGNGTDPHIFGIQYPYKGDEDEGDTTTNPRAKDTDKDGLPDGWIDYDSDTYQDDGEFEDKNLNGQRDGNDPTDSNSDWGSGGETDPNNKNTDSGTINDGEEIRKGLDPLDPSDDSPSIPSTEDGDGDGIADSDEGPGNTYPTCDPNKYDTDTDDLNDGEEVALGTYPNDADSDYDGLIDGKEHKLEEDSDNDGIINVLDYDSDGDWLPDGKDDKDEDGTIEVGEYEDFDCDGIYEKNLGETDPTLADTDKDDLNDYMELIVANSDPNDEDSDNDRLLDGDEYYSYYHTDLNDDDTDGDLLTDGEEVLDYKSYPTHDDSDADGLKDDLEVVLGLDPVKADTDGNGVNDFNEDDDGDGLKNGFEIYIYNTYPVSPSTTGYTWDDNKRKEFLDIIRSNSKSTEFIDDPYGKGNDQRCYITHYHQRSPLDTYDSLNHGTVYKAVVYQATNQFKIRLQSYNDASFTKTPSQNDADDYFGGFKLKDLNGNFYSLSVNQGGNIYSADSLPDGKIASDDILEIYTSNGDVTTGETYIFYWSCYFNKEEQSESNTLFLNSRWGTYNTKIVYICPRGSGTQRTYSCRIDFSNQQVQKLYFKGYTQGFCYIKGLLDSSDDKLKIKLDGSFTDAYTETDNNKPLYINSAFCYCLDRDSTFSINTYYIEFEFVEKAGTRWQFHISKNPWKCVNYNVDPKNNDYDSDGISDYVEAEYYENTYEWQNSYGGQADHKDLFVEVDYMGPYDSNGDDDYDDTGDCEGHEPNYKDVVENFANAPIMNPDGISGINLNIILTEIPHDSPPRDHTTDSDNDGHSDYYENIIDTYFDNRGDHVFYYACNIHEGIPPWGGLGGGLGYAGDIGCLVRHVWIVNAHDKPVVFIHELGHLILKWDRSRTPWRDLYSNTHCSDQKCAFFKLVTSDPNFCDYCWSIIKPGKNLGYEYPLH